MYEDVKVIDCHGHMSTPPEFRAYAYNVVALRGGSGLNLTPEAMRSALDRHLRIMDERNIDIQLLSPRPVAMMHWERPFLVRHWTEVTNEVIHAQCELHPDRFVGIAQLPQTRFEDTTGCAATLERCVNEYGFVGAILNPDPNGDRLTPGMNDPYWFPLYEKSEELQAPLIVHPAITLDPRLDNIPHSYQYNNITEETLAMLLLSYSDLFERYPGLRIVVCHCGGALSRHARGPASGEHSGGQTGLNTREERTEYLHYEHDVTNNLFVDSCAYEPYFLTTAIKQYGVDRILFGTEAPGAGTGTINPDTGRPADDLIPVFSSFDFLTDEDRKKIFNYNLVRVFPLLEKSRALAG